MSGTPIHDEVVRDLARKRAGVPAWVVLVAVAAVLICIAVAVQW